MCGETKLSKKWAKLYFKLSYEQTNFYVWIKIVTLHLKHKIQKQLQQAVLKN